VSFGFFDPGPVQHGAVGTGHHRGTNCPLGNLVVHLFFAIIAVSAHHGRVGIGQQHNGQAEGVNEFVMGGQGIFTDAEYRHVEILQFAVQITEGAGLFGASRGVVFGIKVDNDRFPVAARQGKIGGLWAVLMAQLRLCWMPIFSSLVYVRLYG